MVMSLMVQEPTILTEGKSSHFAHFVVSHSIWKEIIV